ncbi:MAG: hypothetical protein EBZ77_03225, partial [Chitinophagia bacterium]|nr:hypothetical protein [Chitinophagia bacterium]
FRDKACIFALPAVGLSESFAVCTSLAIKNVVNDVSNLVVEERVNTRKRNAMMPKETAMIAALVIGFITAAIVNFPRIFVTPFTARPQWAMHDGLK